MNKLQNHCKMKFLIFLFSLAIIMISFVSVTCVDTPNDYQAVLAETAAQIQQLDSNPGLNSSFSIIGLARCNATVPKDYYNQFYQNVKKELAACDGKLTTTRYTDYSRLILSVTAIGMDARNVGGYNLLSYLSNYDNVSKQGINGSIWALIAVNAKSAYDFPVEKGVAVQTTRTLLVDKILATELKSGGFTMYGNEADIDVTAMAVQALAPYYNSRADVKAAIDRALLIFSGKESNTGTYQSGGIYNAESSAQVLTALSALSIDAAADSRFVKKSGSVLTGLLSYYLGSGRFSHVMGDSSNAITTQQSFYSLTAYDCFQKGGKLYEMEGVPPNPNINNSITKPSNSTEQELAESQTDNETNSKKVTTSSQGKTLPTSKSEMKDEQNADNASSMLISKDMFASLQGKDDNNKIEGKTSDGKAYSWTFHGTDIRTPMDFDGTVILDGEYVSQINELADAPFTFSVGQKDFPGEALLTIETGILNGSYGLFSYDAATQTAQLLSKVKVEGGQTRCMLTKGGNYYIAKKSMATLAKSQQAVTEAQNAKITDKSDTKTGTSIQTGADDSESKYIIAKVIIYTFIFALLTGVFAIFVNKIPESTNKKANNYKEEQDENKMF